jgi:hypothetical protein
LGALFLTALAGAYAVSFATIWHHHSTREKEAELLFVGGQFREAIRRYRLSTPGPTPEYPRSLDQLLLDPRYPQARRYLRKLYPDPMTGRTDWGLVLGPSGELLGVHSRSEDKPIKVAGFSAEDAAFSDKTRYNEWLFVYTGRVPRPFVDVGPAGAVNR